MISSGQLKPLTSIVAIDRNGAIGTCNALPWSLKSDLAFFKRTTKDNTVIMGRKTYDSIGRPLPNRQNVILSNNLSLYSPTATCIFANSIEESFYRAEVNKTPEIFVIGGALTYQQFAPIVDRYLVTIVEHTVSDADAFLSDDILRDIGRWSRNEIEHYSKQEGVDDHAFGVFEIIPDDVVDRQQQRREIFQNYAGKIQNQTKKTRGSSGPTPLAFSQPALL